MLYRPHRMTFGIFMAPFHRVGENPTLALKRDLQLIDHLDELGFDEAWIGEHHSFGRELIADPMTFIAASAQRTRRIKLGTGVVSLPYHHPLIVADKLLQLDHMTEGRAMLGVGPGALTSDAYMMGIDPVTQRGRMNESLDAIMALLRSREPVNIETDWFVLRDARLQMANYTVPHAPVAVAATSTPSGPLAAGKHGIGLLSVAGESGRTIDRGEWRVVVPIHLADSRAEAIADVREGFARRAYLGDRRVPLPPEALTDNVAPGGPATIEEAVEKGAVIVGTPDDAVAQVESIVERSGGLGGILGLAHEWATTPKTLHSYELWARYVAPHFQGQLGTIVENRDWIESNINLAFRGNAAAIRRAFEDSGKELPEEMQRNLEAMRRRREQAEAGRNG